MRQYIRLASKIGAYQALTFRSVKRYMILARKMAVLSGSGICFL
jgi:hypothetical protein